MPLSRLQVTVSFLLGASPMRNRRSGFSLLEVLIVLAVVMVVASMALPNIRTSRILANETVAIESLTALNNVCFVYWTNHDNYPQKISDLAPDFVMTALAAPAQQVGSSGVKAGYLFTYRPGSADTQGKISTYSITAMPISAGTTGVRSFFADESGPIRASQTSEATVDSPSISQGR